ncbi:hypothetical protein JKF63_02228 [Porcisia hertigi]|uniref:Uncharacterized protein n=1 Tax=Porcisia hertigi TaxID=2761500 RepID=A0A836LCI7_9TRYP|nr:hypothetical protein JKF63_02228 [Porcisia hertigi]
MPDCGSRGCSGCSGVDAIAESCAETYRCPFTPAAISSVAVTPSRSPTQLASGASFSFTLVSADDVPLHCYVTPYMCTHSLYLRSARDVGASEGSVPVGSAQAIRDYVAFLQYSELRNQLAAELARSTAATGAPATESSLPRVAPLVRTSRFEHCLGDDDAGKVYDAVRPLLSPCDWDEMGTDGPYGYVMQPLDCDRAYARHTSQLRHWYTATELASFRAEVTSENTLMKGIEDGRHRRSPVMVGASPTSTAESALASSSSAAARFSEPLPPAVASGDDVEGTRHRGSLPRRFSWMQSSSTSSSSSLSSSVSTASLEAYPSAVHATSGVGGGPREGHPRTYLGEQLGYGEFVALDNPECIFFIEHILLAHEPTRAFAAAWTAGVRRTSDTPVQATEKSKQGLISQSLRGAGSALEVPHTSTTTTTTTSAVPFPSHTDPVVTLTFQQQCRLLELISVADYMGTQPLVELCATYLATWLMDHTDEDIVHSFVTTAPPIGRAVGTGAPSAPVSFKVTGAASFKEPWIVSVPGGGVPPAKSSEATNVSLPSAGVLPTSGLANLSTKTVETAAVAKKRCAAAAATALKHVGKEKGNRTGLTPTTAVVPSNYDGCGGGIPTASSDSDRLQSSFLLSADQRLVLLRHMKRDNSIVVSPY